MELSDEVRVIHATYIVWGITLKFDSWHKEVISRCYLKQNFNGNSMGISSQTDYTVQVSSERNSTQLILEGIHMIRLNKPQQFSDMRNIKKFTH